MRVSEIRALSTEELNKQLGAAYKELFDLRFRVATKQLVNVRQIRQVRKNIARLQTVIKERELK